MPRIRALRLASAFVALIGVGTFTQSGTPAGVQQIEINGITLPYVEEGNGAAVVFVHGAVSDLRLWEQQRDAFAKQYRFISYSFRYHGTGSWPDDGKQYSAVQHVADLSALVKKLNAAPAHIVGLSYGGLLAAILAQQQPELVRTLTLAEPALQSLLEETASGKQELETWGKQMGPIGEALKAGDTAKATRHLVAVATGSPPEDFDTLPAPFRQMLLDNARTMPLLFAAPPQTFTCEMLREIKMPTLVVRGERTPRLFATTNDEVVRCIAGSKLAVIPNASHGMSHDNPDEFNRVVLEFLKRRAS